VILDATAGNRHIWGKNKYPEGVVFFDKETNLKIPADVIGTWDKLPFPDDSFDCVIFDPPQTKANGSSPLHHDPKEKASGKNGGACWWGWWDSWGQAGRDIYWGQTEFARVSSRMCFKWNDSQHTLDWALSLFDKWDVQFRQPRKSNTNRSKSRTWWVKLVRR
jgi:hypothetical protein